MKIHLNIKGISNPGKDMAEANWNMKMGTYMKVIGGKDGRPVLGLTLLLTVINISVDFQKEKVMGSDR